MSDDELRAALLAKMRGDGIDSIEDYLGLAPKNTGPIRAEIQVLDEIDPDAPVVEGELQ